MSSGAAATEDPQTLTLSWDGDGDMRAVIVAQVPESLPQTARRGWLAMAQLLVAAHLAAVEAQARAELLEKSERLQQALYEIADLAGSDLEMADMLRRIHAIVAGLMYAENFYIVLYDDVRDTPALPLFRRSPGSLRGRPVAGHPRDRPAQQPHVALLRHGEALRGPSDELRAIRSPCATRTTVPTARTGWACRCAATTASVARSWCRVTTGPAVYRDEERALLSYVAQHILTALDRRQARNELERRVEERTRALQHSNRDLQAEIVERQRGERLQRALVPHCRVVDYLGNTGALLRPGP